MASTPERGTIDDAVLLVDSSEATGRRPVT
jgi:hypothetical protein